MWFDDLEPVHPQNLFNAMGDGPPLDHRPQRLEPPERWPLASDFHPFSLGRDVDDAMMHFRLNDHVGFGSGRGRPDLDETFDMTVKSSLSTEPPEGSGEDIVVTGSYLPGSGSGGGGGGGGLIGDPTSPTASPVPFDIDGGATTDGTPGDDLDHDKTCSTEAGAADQIRDAVLATDTDASDRTQSYTDVEYGAFIVSSNGSYGAANSMIYTDGWESQVFLNDNIPADASSITGIVHNHTGFDTTSQADIRFYSYPSIDDWQTADNLVSRGALASELSIWMIAPDGSLREFQYSQKAYFQSLSESEKMNGVGLPSSSNVEGCGQ